MDIVLDLDLEEKGNIVKQIIKPLIDIVVIFLVCFTFNFSKEAILIGVDYYSGYWGSLIRNGVLPITILMSFACYIPFLIGIRVKKSSYDFMVLSCISFVLFTLFSYNLAILFFSYSGYFVSLSDLSNVSLLDHLYVLLTPVTVLMVGAISYNYSKFSGKHKKDRKEKLSAYSLKILAMDAIFIFLACFAFIIAKEIISNWFSMILSDKGIVYGKVTYNDFIRLFALSFLTTIASFITVYPVFLIGYRILKSPIWLFVLSWLSFALVIVIFYLERINSADEVIHTVLNPRFILAILASVYLIHHSSNNKS